MGMKNIKNKSINYGLKTLTILAFVFIFMPFNSASAQVCGDGGCNTVYNTPSSPVYSNINNPYTAVPNPKPVIDSINPSGSNRGSSPKTITITGSGFVRGSIARVNDSSRGTTFIDDSHILTRLTSEDMNRSNGFFITVYNPAPAGGYSNAIYFTLSNTSNVNNTGTIYPATNTSNNGTADYGNTYSDTSTNNDNNGSDLASNAIFGSNGFLPSGIIQWVLFAILVLVIIIIVRRISGAKQKYEEAPLKHE